jgi:hypothetical protein
MRIALAILAALSCATPALADGPVRTTGTSPLCISRSATSEWLDAKLAHDDAWASSITGCTMPRPGIGVVVLREEGPFRQVRITAEGPGRGVVAWTLGDGVLDPADTAKPSGHLQLCDDPKPSLDFLCGR